MVIWEVRYEPVEARWLVLRAATPFSVHESPGDARAAAEEHARCESDAEARACRVVWCDEDGTPAGEMRFGRWDEPSH